MSRIILDLGWHGVIYKYIRVSYSRSQAPFRLEPPPHAQGFTPPRPIMFSLFLLITVLGLHFVHGQIAQTNATCTSDYAWMGNSKNTSPCMVAAQLNSQCNDGCEFF